ncbi:TPA: amino acid permease [Salmonella enterica subsp. enterica serovar Saintpaul]
MNIQITTRENVMELDRSLKARHLTMISVGGVIGAGFFLGAGAAIARTGPSVVLAYLAGGIVTLFIMVLLAEMSVAKPVSGSFEHYARIAFGPWCGFITGWTYWLAFLIGPASEAIAAGTFLNMWFPGVPVWLFCLVIASSLTVINMVGVHFFGEVEFWLSLVKVVALLAFIVAGCYSLGLDTASPARISNLTDNGSFFAAGIPGFLGAMLMVIFSFGGTEAIGTAAGESEDPQRDIPKTLRGTVVRILLLYVGSLTVLLFILPWQQAGTSSSPYVEATGILGGDIARNLMNFVVLTAALSCIDTGVYATSRMLHAMATERYFPAWFARLHPAHKTPNNAIFASSLVLFAGVIIAILSPDAYVILAGISGFGFLFTWLMIALSQPAMRQLALRDGALLYRAPAAHILQPVTVVLIVLVMAGQFFTDGGDITLLTVLVWLSIASTYYYFVVRKKLQRRHTDEKSHAE